MSQSVSTPGTSPLALRSDGDGRLSASKVMVTVPNARDRKAQDSKSRSN